jgi:hypothetical protein
MADGHSARECCGAIAVRVRVGRFGGILFESKLLRSGAQGSRDCAGGGGSSERSVASDEQFYCRPCCIGEGDWGVWGCWRSVLVLCRVAGVFGCVFWASVLLGVGCGPCESEGGRRSRGWEEYVADLVSEDEFRRQVAVANVAGGGRSAAWRVVKLIGVDDKGAWRSVRECLLVLGDDSREALHEALATGNGVERVRAAVVLAELGEWSEEIRELLLEATNSECCDSRLVAACELGMRGYGSTEILAVLVDGMGSDDELVGLRAACALIRVRGDTEATRRFVERCLASEDHVVRASAAVACGECRLMWARVKLRSMVRDDRYECRRAAEAALLRLGE